MADVDFVVQGRKLVEYKGKEKEVVVPEGIEIIGGSAFRSNKTIERVVLPEGVREIGSQAFGFCKKLRHIVLPDSLEKIEDDAFCKSSIVTIKIPDGVIVIEKNAFWGDIMVLLTVIE